MVAQIIPTNRKALRNVFFLDDENATGVEILRGLSVLSKRSLASSGIGILYFSGRVIESQGSVYLAPYDADPEYPALSISVETLGLPSLERTLYLLDLCIDDEAEITLDVNAAAYSVFRCNLDSSPHPVAEALSAELSKSIRTGRSITTKDLLSEIGKFENIVTKLPGQELGEAEIRLPRSEP